MTKSIGIIVTLALIVYIPWLIFNFSPFLSFNPGLDAYEFTYDNFAVFIVASYSVFPRFSGPFIEPGHLGIVSVFLLYANNFNFRANRYLYPILIGLLLSFSLAGIFLLSVALIIKNISRIKMIIILSLTIGSVFFITVRSWNNGDNPINILLVSRMEYDDEKGIVGNNRVSDSTDSFWKNFLEKKSLLFGLSTDEYLNQAAKGNIGGSGYKMYIIQYGLIKTLLVIAFYFFLGVGCRDKLYQMGFFIIFLLTFFQRSYPLWFALFVPYICGMKNLHRENGQIHKRIS